MQPTGIYIERNAKGMATFVRIDLKKYGEKLKDFFDMEGITIEGSPYDPEFVAKIKRAEKQPSKKIDLNQYGISI
ncbi:MAG: hypothetical protein LBH61_05105 [Dysgonamonadaceae bacterium]|jgi:hypothetical protein|nr:hypothetical protein [Dysgonamonadaceae bacterium]